jgi:hypothetical protein
MKHGSNCDCTVCKLGKKMGMIKESKEKTFTCASCSSESNGVAGDCCGKEREEVEVIK